MQRMYWTSKAGMSLLFIFFNFQNYTKNTNNVNVFLHGSGQSCYSVYYMDTPIPELNIGSTFEGQINISTKGIGYVKVRDLNISIEIPREALNKAFHGDTVTAEVTALPPAENPQGKVTDIIRRAKVGYSGTLGFEHGAHCIMTNDGRMYTSIVIPDDKLNGAVQGDKVFCRIHEWNDPMAEPKGEIVRVLGKPLENNAEMLSLALEKGFDDSYPPAVIKEAEDISAHGITDEEKANRRDFRPIVTFTIDPEDAKDFDDAISVNFLENGNTEVGIHIADVSHYVQPGMAIDTEASTRATSVYLVDRTIPMLPEVLSNDLCSLNPNVDRLTFSAVFTFTPSMEIIDEWYGKTVIYSHQRFSYESAQAVLDTKPGPYLKELEAALAISKVLEKKRFEEGAISLETEEVKFKLDDKGVPISVYKKLRGPTHHMIEELMLLANRKVAEHIATSDKHAEEVFVFRVHDHPDPERVENLQLFLKRIGHVVTVNEHGVIPSKELNDLVLSLEGKPESETVQTAIVRSMAKAIYSTKNIGHYGLAFKYYTHFTSPIRRYPDLVVHRLLFEYLQHKTIPKEMWHYYDEISAHSSQREKEAADAERASIKYKQVEYMSTRIGQTFDGIVTGISRNGMFVEDKETRCEGMVRMRDIGHDYYEYNEKTLTIVGKSTKKEFRIGDRVRMKVTATDINKRLIDYVLV
ncbi:MAG: RNAse [Candidatus Nomurabacteria bacterium]|nr:RNAse [Candidatus Nomurabacteria bacterium]